MNLKTLLIKLIIIGLTAFQAHASFDVSLLDSPYASWGIDPTQTSSIHLKEAWQKFKKKKDIVVAVVDTGIDPNHPFLSANLFASDINQNSFGIDFSKNSVSPMRPNDNHGHGTHVSGIIRSIFPNVKILTLKYYDPTASGEDNLNSTIKALKYAVDQNVDIINYSGGGPESSAEELTVLKEAEKKGILVVAASGNNGNDIDNISKAYFPASYGLKNIITVTAHDQTLNVLDSSNYGIKAVDIAAPGYRIRSALPNGRAGYLTGTSQATAFVSGVAALIKSQYPEMSAIKIKEIIKDSARQELTLVKKCNSQGRLDAEKALNLAESLNSESLKLAALNEVTKEISNVKVGTIIYRKVSSNFKSNK